MIRQVLKRVFANYPSPGHDEISRENAVHLAKRECLRRGWPWRDPARTRRAFGTWEVQLSVGPGGERISVFVRTTDGVVSRAAWSRPNLRLHLSESQAVKIAREEFERLGWWWSEPVTVTDDFGIYFVAPAMNDTWLALSKRDGRVLDSRYFGRSPLEPPDENEFRCGSP